MTAVRNEIWSLLMKQGGKTSSELRACYPVTKERSIRVLREMLKRGYVTREEAGLNSKNVQTYRYFANPNCPPVGRGNFERKPRLRVRVIGDRGGYSVKKVQVSSKARQAAAMRSIACLPIVRVGA